MSRNAKRNERIAEMFRHGMSKEEIAEHFCLAEVSVRDILLDMGVITKAPDRVHDWAYFNWEKARSAARKQLGEMRA